MASATTVVIITIFSCIAGLFAIINFLWKGATPPLLSKFRIIAAAAFTLGAMGIESRFLPNEYDRSITALNAVVFFFVMVLLRKPSDRKKSLGPLEGGFILGEHTSWRGMD